MPVVITGRDSPAVRRRVADLGIAHAVYGASDKLAAATLLLAELGIDWDALAAMGDDWPDLPLLPAPPSPARRRTRTSRSRRWRITSPRPRAATARRASAATCC